MKLDTDTMNATQRALAIINHEEPDRISTYLMGIPHYSKCSKEYDALKKNQTIWKKNRKSKGGENADKPQRMHTPLGDFTKAYYFGTDVATHGVGIRANFIPIPVDQEGNHLRLSKLGRLLVKKKKKSGAFGQTVGYLGRLNGFKKLPNGSIYSWYIDGYLKKKEDAIKWYDKYGWPATKRVNTAKVSQFRQFQANFGDKIFMIPQIGGMQLYESTWPIMGQARWGYYCRKDPDYIHYLINDRKEAQLNILDELARLKPRIIFGGDDLGQKGRPMVSPTMFRKFFKQPYTQIFEKVHDMGAKVFMHSCGNITELLPDYIEAGLDGWQSLEPASLIDHAALKKKYGEMFLFVGGLDSREIAFGNPTSIKKHVKEQIFAMGKGGGYITGPTHDYLTETNLKNALAVRDAISEVGTYPLKE